MRRFIVLIAGLVMATGLAVSGAGGAAAAPNVSGRTYDEAASVIERQNGRPVIAARYGSQLSEGDCIVTDAWDGSFVRDAQGFPSGTREVMLVLNCNARVAAAGRPGNSVTTEEGKSWKTVEHNARLINRNPEVCEESADTQAFCIRFCQRHSDLCSYSG
ncbi:Uncharacterised protein [Mycolicibacterium thermoresistibile]|uniref:Secreted protein n=2 Tax=Mycolicibacterium thermoresistibile TaxID=1797 RepID=A0A100XEC0_MYCTH|nr:putative uncharacterized protein [Mycolicibacterium thermoresistibile]SNW20057.1 Uncharacterised protein [Mycolicibacterium thermoresistibile]